ncbi:MAG: CoB--CoM heterodisulfide reductase iron-sulfur subunit D [Promethearchaeota archaeon]|nr:MAG: CoB--CoM heterodisulfide reductase iron-sulfur subunit D [Candidatus Lokiarchaeota archaeon]
MSKTGLERLQELKGDVFRCIHCKACRFAYSGQPSKKGIGEHKGKQKTVLYEGMVDSCPAGIEYGWEAFWNAGKIWIARSILTGDLEFSDQVRDVIMPCITCGMCSAQCENKVPTVDIIEALRAACVEAGIPMIDKHQLVDRLVKELNNPYGGKPEERFEWAKEAGLEKYINNKDAKIGYYVGCTASYRQKNIAAATCKIFEKLGMNFTLIPEEVCCGSPFFRVGAVDTAQDLMKKNLEAFKNLEKVFFSCAGCYRTFSLDYPKWMDDDELPFETMHAFELITQLIKDNKIKFKANKELKGKTVTYHDPCHTGRHFYVEFEQQIIEESNNLMFDIRKLNEKGHTWFDKPRTILRQLEKDVGIKFTEMYRIKENSMCCGAGGGVRAGYPDFSLRTASLRCDEANAVGADILTTECPFCWRNLSDANELYEHGMEVMGILEMIDKYDLLDVQEKPSEDYVVKLTRFPPEEKE